MPIPDIPDVPIGLSDNALIFGLDVAERLNQLNADVEFIEATRSKVGKQIITICEHGPDKDVFVERSAMHALFEQLGIFDPYYNEYMDTDPEAIWRFDLPVPGRPGLMVVEHSLTWKGMPDVQRVRYKLT